MGRPSGPRPYFPSWFRPPTLAPPRPSLAPIGPASPGPPLRASRHIKAPRPGQPTSTRRRPGSARPSRGPGRGDGGGWCRSSRAPAPSPTVQTVAAAILTARPFPPDCDYRDIHRPGPAARLGPASHPGAAPVTSASPHCSLRKGFSEVSESMLGRGLDVLGSPGQAGGVGVGVGRAVVVVDSRCRVAWSPRLPWLWRLRFPHRGNCCYPPYLRHALGAGPRVIGGARRSDWTAPGLADKLLVPMHAFQHPLDFPAI